MEWDFPDIGGAPQASVVEQVERTRAGRIIANTLTSGRDSYATWYKFDAASRMTQATLSVNGAVDHVLDYGFGTTGTACDGYTDLSRVPWSVPVGAASSSARSGGRGDPHDRGLAESEPLRFDRVDHAQLTEPVPQRRDRPCRLRPGEVQPQAGMHAE